MSLSKKDVEAHYLERFKTLVADFPAGLVTSTEEPDFLVASPDRTIGIELTELHRSTSAGTVPMQASQAMRERVVSRAQDLYIAGASPPIRCTVHFHDRHIEKHRVEELASAIVSIALKNMPEQNGSVREVYEWTNRSYFPEVIHALTVYRLVGLTRAHFNAPGATWVASLTTDDIERTVAAKEVKHAAYRARCDEVWLLINADLRSMSTWFQFDTSVLASPVQTRFDRVFVMRHFGESLHEISVAPLSGP